MVALYSTIDPDAPLTNGFEMLTAVSAQAARAVSAGIPVAPAPSRQDGRVRLVSGFRRDVSARRNPVLSARSPVGMHRRDRTPAAPERMATGNTRYYRADVSRALNMRANATNVGKSNRAKALLFASSMRYTPRTGPWGMQMPAPNAQLLDALSQRAWAIQMQGTLTQRFNLDRLDPQDGHLDYAPMIRAQGMGLHGPV